MQENNSDWEIKTYAPIPPQYVSLNEVKVALDWSFFSNVILNIGFILLGGFLSFFGLFLSSFNFLYLFISLILLLMSVILIYIGIRIEFTRVKSKIKDWEDRQIPM